jgi:NADH:ubiquinone oxidoreductase subunit 3 (subunit A)
LFYLALVAALAGFGRSLAGQPRPNPLKASVYASGEAAPRRVVAPGYERFFAIALFFAVLHLGALVLGTGGLSAIGAIYLAGLLLVLAALMVG